MEKNILLCISSNFTFFSHDNASTYFIYCLFEYIIYFDIDIDKWEKGIGKCTNVVIYFHYYFFFSDNISMNIV